MNANNRIIKNTIILYAKIIINMVISLWTVPLVLRALGQSDYGLYNLVAGVVAMLSFLNGSMTVVVQRYMSVTMGSGDIRKLNNVYNAGLRIHLFLGIIIIILLEMCVPFLFNGVLNIDNGRYNAAIIIFQFMVFSTFFSIISVPFDSVLNAYENMLVFSIIAIVESVMKLLLAIYLFRVSFDRLIVYCFGIVVISIIGVIVRMLIVNHKYKELKISIKCVIPHKLYKEMLSYAGWNTFGSLAVIGKNQGVAIILNYFKGTIINASYGIANQLNGLLSSFTASIQKAVSPQLMKHEGACERDSMIEMSFTLVKMSTIIFALLAIPVVIEMEQLLLIWLHGVIPPYSIIFCQLIIIMQLVFQLSSGVALSIDAVGKIKVYRIVLSAILFFNIPVAYLLLKVGCAPYSVLISMIVVEFICLLIRLYFANHTTDYPINKYFFCCFLPLMSVITISFAVCYLSTLCIIPGLKRIILTFVLSTFITLSCSYNYVLSTKEKNIIISFIKNRR